jgi:hypothetical protein
MIARGLLRVVARCCFVHPQTHAISLGCHVPAKRSPKRAFACGLQSIVRRFVAIRRNERARRQICHVAVGGGDTGMTASHVLPVS